MSPGLSPAGRDDLAWTVGLGASGMKKKSLGLAGFLCGRGWVCPSIAVHWGATEEQQKILYSLHIHQPLENKAGSCRCLIRLFAPRWRTDGCDVAARTGSGPCLADRASSALKDRGIPALQQWALGADPTTGVASPSSLGNTQKPLRVFIQIQDFTAKDKSTLNDSQRSLPEGWNH